MITNREAYERLCERERWDALRAMSVEESIALGEALLTSEVMDIVAGGDGHQPVALAISLGVAHTVAEARAGEGAEEPV